jgi:TetR/AcrR family transcriptional repressor of nem operon
VGYSQTHKEETHARLVRLASEVLRRKGPEKLAVAELMHAAGLTHGGFYAHFKSKEALLEEALRAVFEDARRQYHRIGDSLPPRRALARIIDAYVSSAHRDRLSVCPIVTLNSDLPRQSKTFRATFNTGVAMLVSTLANWIEAAGIADSEAQAASTLSAMAGAVAVSRAVSDNRLSDELLRSTRENIKAQLGLSARRSGGTAQ